MPARGAPGAQNSRPIHYQHDPVQTIKTSAQGAINMLGLARTIDYFMRLAAGPALGTHAAGGSQN